MSTTSLPSVERAVMATTLSHPEWVTHLLIVAEDKRARLPLFVDPDLVITYNAIVKVLQDSEATSLLVPSLIDMLDNDLAEIQEKTKDDKKSSRSLLSLGARKYVQQLLTSVQLNTFEQYQLGIDDLAEKRNERTLLSEMMQLQEDINSSSIRTDAASVARRLNEIADLAQSGKSILTAKDLVENVRERAGVTTWSVSTGLKHIDEALGGRGLECGNVTVIAARAKVGKTTLMIQILKNIIEAGAVGIVLSYETKDVEFVAKLASSFCNINWTLIKDYLATGNSDELSDSDKEEIAQALDKIENSLLYTSFERDATTEDIQSYVAAVKNDYSDDTPIVLFVDYIQIQVSDTRFEREEITRLSRFYKIIAGNAGISVVYLAQINREGADGKPRISNIKGSGSIEADADTVFLLDSPYAREEDGANPYELGVNAAATRVSGKHEATMYIDHATQTVLDEEDAQELLEQAKTATRRRNSENAMSELEGVDDIDFDFEAEPFLQTGCSF